jgi:hypothetical protein
MRAASTMREREGERLVGTLKWVYTAHCGHIMCVQQLILGGAQAVKQQDWGPMSSMRAPSTMRERERERVRKRGVHVSGCTQLTMDTLCVSNNLYLGEPKLASNKTGGPCPA